MNDDEFRNAKDDADVIESNSMHSYAIIERNSPVETETRVWKMTDKGVSLLLKILNRLM